MARTANSSEDTTQKSHAGFFVSVGRWRTAIVFATCLLAAVGCSESDKQKMKDMWKFDSGSGLGSGRRAGDKETWTIECNEFLGPGHTKTADTMATALKRVSGLNPDKVTVQYLDDRSRVYYGTYELKYVEAKGDSGRGARGDLIIQLSQEIKTDLDFIRGLAMGDKFPFFSARPVPQPKPDVGPPEWDLRNARGLYTLQVGVTYPTATLHDYKAAAVEWVKDLRSRGHEAYYYHDPDRALTSICVGTFGADALVDTGDGRTGYSPAVRALREKEEFMYNLENGHKVFQVAPDESGKRVRMPNISFLVEIPRKDQAGATGSLERR